MPRLAQDTSSASRFDPGTNTISDLCRWSFECGTTKSARPSSEQVQPSKELNCSSSPMAKINYRRVKDTRVFMLWMLSQERYAIASG